MISPEKILCPTDFTTESDEALRYAVAFARAYEAKLLLLHCVRENAVDVARDNGKIETRINRFISASLPQIELTGPSSLNWESVVRHNVHHIGKAIVEEAVTQEVDLIVMRSRRRPRAAVLLGSTAETVCRTARCPVLVTHPREREWVSMSAGEIELNRILIAHDFSPASEMAMKYGISLAQEYQADVHLLHVLATDGKEEPELAWSSSAGGNASTFTAQKLQHALPSEVHLWCELVNVVRCGKAYEEILTYAQEREIDLICMGVSCSQWSMERMLGSNVDRVLRHAPCPVLVGSRR